MTLPCTEAGVSVPLALTYVAVVDGPSSSSAASQHEASEPPGPMLQLNSPIIRAAQTNSAKNPVLAQTPGSNQVSSGAKTPPQKAVPAAAEFSNDVPVQPDADDVCSELSDKQIRCKYFFLGQKTFATPLGEFSCIDKTQCELKCRRIKK